MQPGSRAASQADLAVTDVAAVSQTILAAVTGCGGARLLYGSSLSAAASRLGPRNGRWPESWAASRPTASGGG